MTFTGFPQSGLIFLTNLAANNDRAWFDAHKAEYKTTLLEPAQAFVEALGEKLQSIAPGIRADTSTNGQGVLMRIQRDTRYSPDKSPYKTEITGLFWEGPGKKTECPAFGFRLVPEGLDLMAGIFKFPSPMLAAYREAVHDKSDGPALVAAIDAVRSTGPYTVAGEHYKRVPAGLDASHSRADLLRYDGLYVISARIGPAVVTSAALVEMCSGHFEKMAPIQRWLMRVM